MKSAEESRLPPESGRKVIYLDQCLISAIVKRKEEFWGRLYEKLRLLLSRQLIVCPISQFHVEESLLSEQWRDELLAMCQELAGPYRFRPPQEIELAQLRGALRCHFGQSQQLDEIQAWEDCGGDPVHFVADEAAVSKIRQTKEDTYQRIKRLAQGFRDFQSAVVAEIDHYAEEILEQFAPGEAGAVYLVEELQREAVRLQPAEQEPMSLVRAFLKSDSVQAVPFLDIRSRLWATVAQHIQSQVKPRKIKASDIYDVQAISYYGPYCDAIFVDNEFRKLACQRNVDVPGRYGIRLFSETNREEFRAYLGEIQQAAG